MMMNLRRNWGQILLAAALLAGAFEPAAGADTAKTGPSAASEKPATAESPTPTGPALDRAREWERRYAELRRWRESRPESLRDAERSLRHWLRERTSQ